MSKRAKILLFSALGLLVVVAVAVTTVVLVIHQNHKNDVAAADRAAADYLDEVAAFREEQAEILADEAGSDLASALDAIDAAVEEIPAIGDAPEYGRENSDDYVEAAKAEQDLEKDLDALATLAEDTLDTTEFVDATVVALDRTTPGTLLGTGPFSSGQPVRDATIPGMQAVKDTFESVEVPAGFEEAAELTSAALQHVLDNLNQMAASLDGGQSYYFEFSEQYNTADLAVVDAVGAAEDTMADAIEAFGTGDDVEAPSSDDSDEEPGDEPSEDSARDEEETES
ncbi:hypothetical protein [Aeromicrobium sp. Leaf350]|uniref:hypothetical protein n=1 Tax=Aeromicrobium sp. Leaf350 TaxID=2876565 RepID=UPI001E5E2BEF|nr:hypothetical protein [Aeromicrobium sp. Leaf350]